MVRTHLVRFKHGQANITISLKKMLKINVCTIRQNTSENMAVKYLLSFLFNQEKYQP